MKNLQAEIKTNYAEFTAAWKAELQNVIQSLDAHDAKFLSSYTALTSLQAWRSELLEQTMPSDALAFYLEAQNDAVTSHYLARQGSWRSALKALRSCIENVMQSLYYHEHPVELKLWHAGKHFLQRPELISYLEKHPNLDQIPAKFTGLPTLGSEYTTLNNAVHASAKGFRMTADGNKIQLATTAMANLGPWLTRERHVITAVNLLLLSFFAEKLANAALPNLRKCVSLVIPAQDHAEIRTLFSVTLYKP